MKKNISLTLTLTLCIMICLAGCQKKQEAAQKPAMAVTALTIELKDVPAVFEYVAVAESSHLVEIRARVEGYLDKIVYEEGALVKENDLLFLIDPRPFEASLAQARAQEEQQAAFLWQAQRAVERLKPLYEQKAASLRDLDNATAQELAAQASLDAAKAQVVQAELNLSYTTIRSPITGMSNQAKYRQGALVGPGSSQTLLTTIYVMDPIWVNFNVSEGDLLKYRTENEAGRLTFPKDMNFEIEVVLADDSIMPTTGKVDFANPSLQQSTGSMLVRAVVPNPNTVLRPGQFVRARLKGAFYPKAISVPQKAILQGRHGLYVLTVDSDNKVKMQPVQTGDWAGSDWIVQSGLKPGDRVITEGTNKVMPGMTVMVTPQGKKA